MYKALAHLNEVTNTVIGNTANRVMEVRPMTTLSRKLQALNLVQVPTRVRVVHPPERKGLVV